jgi:hypothetical protein
MLTKLFTAVRMLTAAILVAAAGHATATDTLKPVPASIESFIPWIGEKIDFHVSFGVIPAGKAQLQVIDTVTVDGHLTLHAMSSARSAKAFDVVFKVRDTVETWFDADSIYSLRFRKKLREGRYRDEKVVIFDQKEKKVHWWDDGQEKPTISVEPRMQDVLSAGYKARFLPFAEGDTFFIKTHDVDKTYDLMVVVHRKETVETLAGKFECFKIEPVLKSGGLFQKEKSARVFVWVTTDVRRIPVMMQSKVSFGSITAQMESYTPPRSSP